MIHIHTTKEQVLELAQVFGKLTYLPDGSQSLDVPEWIEMMWENSSDGNSKVNS